MTPLASREARVNTIPESPLPPVNAFHYAYSLQLSCGSLSILLTLKAVPNLADPLGRHDIKRPGEAAPRASVHSRLVFFHFAGFLSSSAGHVLGAVAYEPLSPKQAA